MKYILMIIRGIPSKNYPQWGCFEKDQAEALAKAGHKVVCLSLDSRFRRHRGRLGLHTSSENGVTFYNYVSIPAVFYTKLLGQDWYVDHVSYPIIKKCYDKITAEYGKPDIIYTQFFWNTALGVRLKDYDQVPVVGIEHLARFNEPRLTKHDEKWSSYAFNGADKMIAVAGTLAHNLKKRFGLDFEVVHNMYGKEFDSNHPIPALREQEPLRFITVGSLVKRKGFDCLIDAFALAKIPAGKWKLDIIGGGEEYDNLKRQIAEKGLEVNIRLMGEMNKKQIASELEHSNVFVLPSRNENFSVAILEGLAMGLPVLSTDCGGIRECLTEKNGVIVPVDDREKMAEALKHFVSNYSEYDREYIRQDCKDRFSPETIAARLTEIFESVK